MPCSTLDLRNSSGVLFISVCLADSGAVRSFACVLHVAIIFLTYCVSLYSARVIGRAAFTSLRSLDCLNLLTFTLSSSTLDLRPLINGSVPPPMEKLSQNQYSGSKKGFQLLCLVVCIQLGRVQSATALTLRREVFQHPLVFHDWTIPEFCS